MERLSCYLDDGAFVRHLSNLVEDVTIVNQFISTMECIKHSYVCDLYMPSNFYAILAPDGECISQKIFCHYEDGNIRDSLVRLQMLIREAQTFPDQTNGLNLILKEGKGGLIGEIKDDERGWSNELMYAIMTPSDLRSALRKYYVAVSVDQKYFLHFRDEMFDQLIFSERAKDIKDLRVNYVESISSIIRHLSYLNDHASKDFGDGIEDREKISRASARGVEISPEGVLTRNNSAAMKMRNIDLMGVEVCCEWHTKVEPTRGRVYFNAQPNRPDELWSICGDKVVIGIFAEHL